MRKHEFSRVYVDVVVVRDLLCLRVIGSGRGRTSVAHGVAVLRDRVTSSALDDGLGGCGGDGRRGDDGGVVPYSGRPHACTGRRKGVYRTTKFKLSADSRPPIHSI